jgi:hypothetical protein
VGTFPCRKQSISSDGGRIAAECEIERDGPWRVVWFDANGRNMHVVPQIPVSGLFEPAPASWVPGDEALSYIDTQTGVSNIISVSVKTGRTKTLTHFIDESIFDFEWSRDRKLALVRGESSSDVIAINLRPTKANAPGNEMHAGSDER